MPKASIFPMFWPQRTDFLVLSALLTYIEEKAKKIMANLLDAIHYLHKNGVCHRDITAQNIILNEETLSVKLIDFNVSKRYSEGDIGAKVLKRMGTHTGTLSYSAPELLEGEVYKYIANAHSLVKR